jgi:hypothetical protein
MAQDYINLPAPSEGSTQGWLSKVFQRLGGGRNNIIYVPSFAKAALPPADAQGLIYVTDETGGAVIAFSDGTNWRRVTDRAIVS